MKVSAPIKSKIFGTNHAPYMSKTLPKVVMRRSSLEIKYLKMRSKNSFFKTYTKEKKYCSRLHKKKKKRIF